MFEKSFTPSNRTTFELAVRAVRDFAASEVRGTAARLAVVLVCLLSGINVLNVVNSYVGRDFMTALENRDGPRFQYWLAIYVLVFAASTFTAVWCRYAEERLGLLWREWLTRRLLQHYLDRGAYYELTIGERITNPDQRIADDVRVLTTGSLGFLLIIINSGFTIVAFSGVAWSISPWLFGAAVVYASFGTLSTMRLGHQLVRLNYDQSDREAHLRRDLIHVREHAESVVLARREGRLRARLSRRVDEVTANMRRIIGVSRNLNFFTTGYNYMTQVIPVLVVGPMFMKGSVEFGVVTQATMAFTHLLGAFSVIVTQYQSLSSLAAVVSRLAALREAISETHSDHASPIEIFEDPGAISYRGVTLLSPRDGRTLLRDFTQRIDPLARILVVGPEESGRSALFHATAGLWKAGSGCITRPSLDQVLFVPERPYLPPATLREALVRTGAEQQMTDDDIYSILAKLDLELVIARAEGLDTEHDWRAILSLGEQHSLALARILLAAPAFAFLDRPGTALDGPRVERVLSLLTEAGIGYVHFSDTERWPDLHDAILEVRGDGCWTWRQIEPETPK